MTADDALLELLGRLQARQYRFTTVTPETHALVLERPGPVRLTLRDIFGWNRPFDEAELEPQLLELMRRADAVEETNGLMRSRLRVASLGDRLFLHSSFPTTSANSVFFGPDTYRFANFVLNEMRVIPEPRWIMDMGAGTGAGGIAVAAQAKDARLSLIDLNPEAARLARINANFAGVAAEVIVGDGIPVSCDLVIANPPYMIDSAHRAYRDGRGLLGGEVALGWAEQALASFTRGGTLLLYTGAAVVDGAIGLLDALATVARDVGATITHTEIDPDVFGNELVKPEYATVERIAAFGIKLVLQ